MLVFVSLGAMLAAIGGFGSTPMRKSNGISPYMGVNCGQVARVAVFGARDRTPKSKPALIAPITSAMIRIVLAVTEATPACSICQ